MSPKKLERKELAPREIHIWRALIRTNESSLDSFYGVLSPNEVGRADRFVFKKDRHAFVVRRGILRNLLSLYTGINAHAIEFCRNAYGKPYQIQEPTLQFNTSQSGDFAVFAFVQQVQIGIDIQKVKKDIEYLDLARRYFSSEEADILESLPRHQGIAAFFSFWSRKEALVKALGNGLSLPLEAITVTNDQATHLNENSDYSIWDFPVALEYSAAVAIPLQTAHFKYFELCPDSLTRRDLPPPDISRRIIPGYKREKVLEKG